MPKNLLATGSSGLIGSEAVKHFTRLGYQVHGIDNNQRQEVFGTQSDTLWNLRRLQESILEFNHRTSIFEIKRQ